eukprot:TRINITY_DN39128_c0_g1_i1.p1 TRINITY_DN39128_c0_g1~~TRINITY_DN39128_c0_g1_i1.p1  ORF type:complete len:293 (+),score=52.90 TRINITY_DN39128_c0_g1_i1:54-881(+)
MARLLAAAGALPQQSVVQKAGECGLLLFVQYNETTLPIDLPLDATVGALRKAAVALGVPENVDFRFGDTVLEDPAAELADLGLSAEVTLHACLRSRYKWDPTYASSGAVPSYYQVGVDEYVVEKTKDDTLTYGLAAERIDHLKSCQVRIRVITRPDWKYKPAYESGLCAESDQRQHDGIGLISEKNRTYMCSAGARLRMADGQVFAESQETVDVLRPVREGDVVVIDYIPDQEKRATVRFSIQGEDAHVEVASTLRPPIRPCVQCEKTGWKFGLV